MEINFKGTPKEVVKQMQDFLATMNVELTNQKEVPPFIELTGNQNNVERIKDLREVFEKNGLDWLSFKRNFELEEKRTKHWRYIAGIKIIDN